ncbi:MAG: DUF937 domain-containing protein [Acidobacteriota bacterium]
MSNSILDLIGQQLDGNAIQAIGQQIGANSDVTEKAVNAALPMLIGSLANNTQNAGGANALAGALDRDHDGSILDDVAGFLGGGQAGGGMGQAILGHILGGRQGGAENALGKVSGLNSGQAGQLLSMLAPLVLGALGKQKRQGGLDGGGLASILAGDRQRVEQSQPGAGGLLAAVIDQDGDGDIGDDLAKIGGSLLGGLLGGRR